VEFPIILLFSVVLIPIFSHPKYRAKKFSPETSASGEAHFCEAIGSGYFRRRPPLRLKDSSGSGGSKKGFPTKNGS